MCRVRNGPLRNKIVYCAAKRQLTARQDTLAELYTMIIITCLNDLEGFSPQTLHLISLLQALNTLYSFLLIQNLECISLKIYQTSENILFSEHNTNFTKHLALTKTAKHIFKFSIYIKNSLVYEIKLKITAFYAILF